MRDIGRTSTDDDAAAGVSGWRRPPLAVRDDRAPAEPCEPAQVPAQHVTLTFVLYSEWLPGERTAHQTDAA